MSKRLLVPITLLLVVSMVAGCKPAAKEPIKIGLQAPITGEYAYEGEGFVKVVDLVVEQINEKGILGGRKIEIVKCDDVGKPDESSKCANQLVSAGVKAVVGSYSSTCTEPASEIYNEAGILQITPSSTATRTESPAVPSAPQVISSPSSSTGTWNSMASCTSPVVTVTCPGALAASSVANRRRPSRTAWSAPVS